MSDSLKAIYTEYDKDPAFKHLRKGRNFVPGKGSHLPALIIVGEAPGEKEDEQAVPFVGRSGKVLDELLRKNMFAADGDSARNMVWITNVIKYRPPDNRTPTEEEIEAARPYLKRELAIVGARKSNHRDKPVRPIICLMGKTAGLLLGKKHGLKRGEVTTIKGWRFAYLYHPAVALYDPKMKATLDEHFRSVCKYI